jgi:plasmid stability protein
MTAQSGHERSVEAERRILRIADLEERVELVL